MKDLNDLLAQFESIQDNDISEETLGAYLEGNLNPDEFMQVENAISQDDSLSAFIEDVSALDTQTDDSSFGDLGMDMSGLEILADSAEINLFDDYFDAAGHFLGFDLDDGTSNWDHHISSDDGFDSSGIDSSGFDSNY